MRASFTALLALAAAAVASPLDARQLQYNLYNDGTRGSVTSQADDFGATYHTSAFMSRQGCSSSAKITYCYAADLAADPTKMLETADYAPYITGGVGTNQRALLLGPTHANTTADIVTHTVRFHLSTTYTQVPVGFDTSVTLVGLRSFEPWGPKFLDIRARTFTGEETSGTMLYVSSVSQNGQEDFPLEYPLASAVGKTIEVTYRLGVSGATVDPAGVFVGEVSAKFVDGGAQLFKHQVTKTQYPKGIINHAPHRLIFGADRKVSAGQQQLKTWFGDYSVSPLPVEHPEKRSF